MTSRKKLLHLFYFSTFFFLLPLSSNCTDPLGNFCNNNNNITNSQTSANINKVLAELLANASVSGFATASYGSKNDQVFGLAQCRGDVSAEDCKSCLADAAERLPKLCTKQADARIWFDYCFLRYDTQDFLGELDTGFGIFYWNVENVTEPERFDAELGKLMDGVRKQAVASGSRGLGKGESKFSNFVTIYGLVQCTEDLSRLSCAQCLAIAEANFPKFCLHRKGCRVLYSSCYVRYELYPFFFPLDESTSVVVGTSAMTVVYP